MNVRWKGEYTLHDEKLLNTVYTKRARPIKSN